MAKPEATEAPGRMSELCALLLKETGVAILPGASFGRDPKELTARISYVNFDGAQALAAVTQDEIGEEFLRRHCGECLEAVERICSWVESVEV